MPGFTRMKKFLTGALLVAATLGVATGPLHAQELRTHEVPLFRSASHPLKHQGFVRVINHSGVDGEVRIDAFDDAGVAYGPVTLSIAAWETVHFNSGSLEQGDAGKGLPRGIGPGTGDWRLLLRSDLNIEVLAYNRTGDGLLAGLHDLVPPAMVRRPGTGDEVMGHRVAIFNPGKNVNQVSRLRIINPGEESASVTIEGIDDDGRSPGTAVTLSVPARASHTLTAQDLESGNGAGLTGMLGDGEGKWQLVVTSDQPIEVMSLLTSPTGHLTNLSTEPGIDEEGATHGVPLFASASNPDGYQGFVRVINHSDEGGEVRIEAFDDAGVPYGPVTLSIAAGKTVHLNSGSLEQGDAGKGLSQGIGTGTGDWRLLLRSDLDIDVLAYNRTDDGMLASLHDLVPYAETVRPGGEERTSAHYVAIFNPATNINQVSRLRIINPSTQTAMVAIEGIDDDGQSPGTGVQLPLPAGASRTLTSQELESGEWQAESDVGGFIGDGGGKWRLLVTSDQPIEVMSLMATPTGHLVNLSTARIDALPEIVSGESVAGSIDSADDVARYRLRLTEAGIVSITFSADLPGAQVSLLDDTGHVLAVAEIEAAAQRRGAGQGLAHPKSSIRCSDECAMEVVLEAGEYLIEVAMGADPVQPLLQKIAWKLLSKVLEPTPVGQTEPLRLRPEELVGLCRCWVFMEPGQSTEIRIADFIESPAKLPLQYGPLGKIPPRLTATLDESTGRLTISAPQDTAWGIYKFGVAVDELDPRGPRIFVIKVNVGGWPRVLPGQSLTLRATAGRRASLDLDDVIGPPEHVVGYRPLIRFNFAPETPEDRTNVRRLAARIEHPENRLVVSPPSDLAGELSLRVSAWFLGTERAQVFTFRVIVEAAFAPENQEAFYDRFRGKSIGVRSVYSLALTSSTRFREVVFGETYRGSYTYRNTGPNSGTVQLRYDDRDRCTVHLAFDSLLSGTFTSTCLDTGRLPWSV